MKKSEVKMIILIIVVWVIVLGVVKSKQNTKNYRQDDVVDESEEFVEIMEDGTKLNVSEKFQEEKNLNGISFKNIQFTNKEGQTLLLADITNETSDLIKEQYADLIIYDKNKNELGKFTVLISELKPGQTKQFNVSMQLDYSNAYDFEILNN